MSGSRRLPVSVIGGYLGAGKTTLVNHLLRNAAGRRLAVMVNDFGALEIDAALIESRDGDVISLAGGCICCSFGSDLMEALVAVAAREPRPDHVLLETSGVALPRMVAQSVGLLPQTAPDAVLVLVDAETVRQRAADRYLADTVLQQLADADLLIVNKIDLVEEGDRIALRDWLSRTAPNARVLECERAAVPLEVLIGPRAAAERSAAAGGGWLSTGRIAAPRTADARYATLEFTLDAACDPVALCTALTVPELGVLRAKGILRAADGTWQTLQLVGRRREVVIHHGPPPIAGSLVCIGVREALDAPAVERAVRRAGGRRSSGRETAGRRPSQTEC